MEGRQLGSYRIASLLDRLMLKPLPHAASSDHRVERSQQPATTNAVPSVFKPRSRRISGEKCRSKDRCSPLPSTPIIGLLALIPGARIGPYEVLARLGAGGMGEVYKARDVRLDRAVAIKVLSSHLASDAQFRQRFEREARTLASLSHPHISPSTTSARWTAPTTS